MKKITKMLSLILGTLFALGAFASCGIENGQTNNSGSTQTTSAQSETHYANVTKRSDYIVKNGQAYYTLVVPKTAERYETKAAELLVEYYQKALGVTLKTVTDDKATNKEGRYISIGDTTLLQNSGISIPEEKYGSSGFRIITKANTVYIAGARTMMRRGTYYGAQEFLKHTIDWEAYTASEIRYTKTDTVAMSNFDVVEIPDFDHRRAGYQTTMNDNEYTLLLRMTPRHEEDELKLSGHSHFEILPPEKYYAEHPDWYYPAGDVTAEDFSWRLQGQLCLTNEEMTAEFIKNVTQLFIENPKVEFIHIGHMDSNEFCACENCKEWIKSRNTNDSGLMVDFTNRVARGVTANMKKIDPNRKLMFEFFAYLKTIAPPTDKTVDAKGNAVYVADHPDVIPDENVMVQFTPLLSQNMVTLDHLNNKQYYEYFQGWSAICDNISVWKYAINFSYYMINLKNWDVIGEDFNIYKQGGVQKMYEQGPLHHTVLQMHEMRTWIYGKMMWNTSLNYSDLARQFIAEFYGPAAAGVQEYYDYMTTYCEKIRVQDGYTGTCYSMITDEKYWSFPFVEGGRQIFMHAYENLEEYKASDDYEKYYWRLTGVYFENMFMQLEYHMSQYSVTQNRATLAFFKQARDVLALRSSSENGASSYATYETKWEGALDAF